MTAYEATEFYRIGQQRLCSNTRKTFNSFAYRHRQHNEIVSFAHNSFALRLLLLEHVARFIGGQLL